MEQLSLQALQAQEHRVLWLSFLLAVLLGAWVQRTHFCTMGALSDWLLMRDATRLRQWALAVGVAALGLAGMAAAGWVSPLNTIYAMPRFPWLSYLLGGLLFGVGMVLSSGCPMKNLVRLGGGNLKALLVLLMMGFGALATLRGGLALWRVHGIDVWTFGVASGPFLGQGLALWTGWSVAQASLLLALLVSVPVLFWVLRGSEGASTHTLMAGGGVGGILLATWWVSGVLGFVPEHPQTLESVFLASASGRMEGLSFIAPVAQWLDAFLYFADGRIRITLGMAMVPGVVLGAACMAWRSRTFRWEGFIHTDDLVRHLAGGLLMGIGGVAAMGCTFGQGLTGLSTLNWGSLLAVAAMVLGALLALRVQWWLAERHV